MYFVYVLRCVDSSLYCGYTTDVPHRVLAHTGKIPGGAKYTRSHPPVSVEAVWEFEDKCEAQRFEYRFKRLKKDEKEASVDGGDEIASAVRRRDLEGAVAEV